MSLSPRVAATLLALALLPACTSTAAPTTTPSSTYWCTPLRTPGVPQGAPYRCSASQSQWNAEQLAREAEAIRVYARYFEELYRLHMAGGTTELTPVLLETTDGGFQTAVRALLKDQIDNGFTIRGSFPTFKAAADRSRPQTAPTVVLITCEDARQAAMYNPDGSKYSDGFLKVYRRSVKPVDRHLKIYSSEEIEGASSCPID